MSVYGMKPQFTDWAGYQAWRSEWAELYALLTTEVREAKWKLKHYQRSEHPDVKTVNRQYRYKRAMARKLMTVLNEAKIRWGNIRDIKKGIAEQMAQFPLTVEGCRNIDFHFNKKSLEFPFVPAWVVKAKGKSYYVNHVDCETPWTTRERPDHPSTKGSIRIKRGNLTITTEGGAIIS